MRRAKERNGAACWVSTGKSKGKDTHRESQGRVISEDEKCGGKAGLEHDKTVRCGKSKIENREGS